ncbi:MAG: hypothetical protein HN368_03090 [Spirochaetales bacterium]|jgi:hypothetical protein|nr:hypothetical protein [Spirochaetales bacterium]
MKYLDLEDKIIQRLARHSTVIAGDAVYTMTAPRNPQGAEISAHLKAERVVNSPDLESAMADVEAAEGKIRRINLNNLSSQEKRNFESSVFSELIKSVETRRIKRVREISKKIDERKAKHAIETPIGTATRQLLALEESKLRHSRIMESEAMSILNGFERRGYGRADLLVLGAISDRTNAKAAEVRETIPAHLADADGVKIIKELEQLVSLKPGEIPYYFAGSDSHQVVHVADLLGDTSPTIQDIAS